jgi:hypothetical protein
MKIREANISLLGWFILMMVLMGCKLAPGYKLGFIGDAGEVRGKEFVEGGLEIRKRTLP